MKSTGRPFRIIARLDVKGPNLIKGVHLEGLRIMGDPHSYALKYYEQGADELIYLDIVASLYGRSNLQDIVRKTAKDVFILRSFLAICSKIVFPSFTRKSPR